MATKNILILDDEELTRKVLDTKIKSLDYNTCLAQDGPEAIDMLKKNKIDTAKECTFLREEQIKALSEKLGEAISWNRKLNDERMGKLDKSKSWAIFGYLCVFFQHFFIVIVNAVGVP